MRDTNPDNFVEIGPNDVCPFECDEPPCKKLLSLRTLALTYTTAQGQGDCGKILRVTNPKLKDVP